MFILEFNDQVGLNVFSYNSNGNFADIKNSATNLDGQYIQASVGTDVTNATAVSGCQAVFHLQINNAEQLFSGNNNYYAKLPTPGGSYGNSKSQPYILGDTTLDISVTNTTNIYAEMKIYDYVYRKETPAGIQLFNLWNNGLSKESANDVQTVYMFTNKTTPFDSQLFCQFIKVVKTTTVFLGPGATHSHLHKHWIGKSIYPSRFYATTGCCGGITSGTLFTVIGQPVEATSGSAGAVTTGIVDLNVISKMKSTLGQKYNNKVVYTPTTSTSLYQATQTVGVFKAMIDDSRKWTTEIEGG